MADSKLAVFADWRLAFGHPILTIGGNFSQNGGFLVKKRIKVGFFDQNASFYTEISYIIFINWLKYAKNAQFNYALWLE